FKPDAQKLIHPTEGICEEIDGYVKTAVDYMSPAMAHKETSTYHGKMLTIDNAKKLLSLKEDLNAPSLPESIVPYDIARDLIINGPEEILVMTCACREVAETGCHPRDVCLIVGEPFVSFWMEHNKMDNPRRITQAEALEIVQAEHERGHVQMAWFKDAMANRFYALCNCCSCCCTGMIAHKYTPSPAFAGTGYTATRTEDCVGCGKCAELCPFEAITLVDDKSVVNWDLCMGCGVCQTTCPNGAAKMVLEPKKGDPLDIDKIVANFHQPQQAAD
ncbi:MAG TPA: 4Fe-4S binding protein, partial [Syntrophomonas sp.]|nr:4Fe-4S binding protein [Syntrophomonas sp.]